MNEDLKKSLVVVKMSALQFENAAAQNDYWKSAQENGTATKEATERLLIASNKLAGAIEMVRVFYGDQTETRKAIYREARELAGIA